MVVHGSFVRHVLTVDWGLALTVSLLFCLLCMASMRLFILLSRLTLWLVRKDYSVRGLVGGWILVEILLTTIVILVGLEAILLNEAAIMLWAFMAPMIAVIAMAFRSVNVRVSALT